MGAKLSHIRRSNLSDQEHQQVQEENTCITGSELVEWLMRAKSVTKDQAIVIGQALLHGKWLECAYRGNASTTSSSTAIGFNHQKEQSQSTFYDANSFYKPGSVSELA